MNHLPEEEPGLSWQLQLCVPSLRAVLGLLWGELLPGKNHGNTGYLLLQTG